MTSQIQRVASRQKAERLHDLVKDDPRLLGGLRVKELHLLASFHALLRSRTRDEVLAKLVNVYAKKPELTPEQAKIVTRKVEFSVHARMDALVKAFPSVTFAKKGSNGGVTYYYELTGPTVWVDKIEARYSY